MPQVSNGRCRALMAELVPLISRWHRALIAEAVPLIARLQSASVEVNFGSRQTNSAPIRADIQEDRGASGFRSLVQRAYR